MDKTEHATHLRRAMAVSGLKSEDVATLVGVSKRAVTYWISPTEPTMPSDAMRESLRRILSAYGDEGDPVENAIERSELAPHRKAALIAEYKKLQHKQAREESSTG